MWSVWLVFCDCGFQSVCPLMDKKRLMEASWWERLTEEETGSCSDGWGHPQYIFNPIFCWWAVLCSLPIVWPETKLWWRWWRWWRPPSEGPTHALLHSVSLALQQATADTRLRRRLLTLPGKSGSVSCGVTAPFSWVLVQDSTVDHHLNHRQCSWLLIYF